VGCFSDTLDKSKNHDIFSCLLTAEKKRPTHEKADTTLAPVSPPGGLTPSWYARSNRINPDMGVSLAREETLTNDHR